MRGVEIIKANLVANVVLYLLNLGFRVVSEKVGKRYLLNRYGVSTNLDVGMLSFEYNF